MTLSNCNVFLLCFHREDDRPVEIKELRRIYYNNTLYYVIIIIIIIPLAHVGISSAVSCITTHAGRRLMLHSFDFRAVCAVGCVRESRISHSALVTRVQLNMTSRVSISPVADHNGGPVLAAAVRISSAHHIRTPIVHIIILCRCTEMQ